MNVQKLVTVFFFLVLFISAGAQIFPIKNYPRGYFQWPLVAKVGLAANFGELRPNHYHMGLDCKTDQKENTTVIFYSLGSISLLPLILLLLLCLTIIIRKIILLFLQKRERAKQL